MFIAGWLLHPEKLIKKFLLDFGFLCLVNLKYLHFKSSRDWSVVRKPCLKARLRGALQEVGGIYLPLGTEDQKCSKDFLALAYRGSHFVALVTEVQ